MLRRIYRYYAHPYRQWLLPVSVGVGVYFYLLWERYQPLDVLLAGPKQGGLQGIVDWFMASLLAPHLWIFIGWTSFFLALTAGWIFFFAQFALPVRRLDERWAIFARLGYYIAGLHGPAIFIQDGVKIESSAERLRKGPGVIVLDSASAAVLQTESNFTRAVGPGVVFTKNGEIAEKGAVLDLHKRSASAGPKGNEDPFAPRGEDEDEEAYQERIKRRWETSAKTRDGTEVIARIVVVFSLDPQPDGLSPEEYEKGKFNTNFSGHEQSAWRAVTHRPIDAEKAEQHATLDERLLSWDWLPARLAADLWREYLQHFRLSTLFEQAENGQAMVDFIAGVIKERLMKPHYRELGVDGQWTGKTLPSREYALLQERGIRVITAVIPAIYLPPAVEEKLVERWTANWLVRAKKERELVEHRRNLAKKHGEEAAARLWADVVASACHDAEASSLPRVECLDRLLAALSNVSQRDPGLYLAQKSEFGALEMLWAWVHNRIERDDGEGKK